MSKSAYIDSKAGNNDKDPKFKGGCRVRMYNIKKLCKSLQHKTI